MADHFRFTEASETTMKYEMTNVLVSSYQMGGGGFAPGFTADGGETQIALLLPAVQQARETPPQTTVDVDANDWWFGGEPRVEANDWWFDKSVEGNDWW